MQITHEEARTLIQFKMDEALNAQQASVLSAHIHECIDCRRYAAELTEVENALVPVMKKHWALPPPPLSIPTITAQRTTKTRLNVFLATRRAAIGAVLLAFMFSAWQFALTGGAEPTQAPAGILPIPTPSAQSTTATFTRRACDPVVYVVQEYDTLEKVADRFAVSKEDIREINNIDAETLQPTMALIIPVCNFTPTGTVHPATLSTRDTPASRPTTGTPKPSG